MNYQSAHATDYQVEQYCRGTLLGEELDGVEEHLLLCESCRERVADEDALQAEIRATLKNRPVGGSWLKVRNPIVWSGLLLAITGTAALLVMNGTYSSPPPLAAPLALAAFRSSAEPVVAPADAALPLVLDLKGVPAANLYRVQVADASGETAWTGDARSTSGAQSLNVTLDSGLKAGRYWVRLLDANGGKTVREFQLDVR